MTITIEFSSEEAANLERDAERRGVAPEERVRSLVVGGLAQATPQGRYPGLRDLFTQWQNDAKTVDVGQRKRDEAGWAAAQESVRQHPLEI